MNKTYINESPRDLIIIFVLRGKKQSRHARPESMPRGGNVYRLV